MVSDGYIELPGVRLHYREWGGQGKPLVLLHGLASTCNIWNLTAPLLNREYRVLALDQRGHGRSDKPDDGYDFPTICGDLREFCLALDLDQPVLVGHSWGASVALQYAADYAQDVSGLVLVDGGFTEMSARMSWEEAEVRLAPPQLAGMPLDDFLAMARGWPGIGEIWSPDVEHIVLANFELSKEQTIRPRLSRANHMKILRSLYDQKSSQLFPLLPCPVLVVPARREPTSDGERDWLMSKLHAIRRLEEHLDHRLRVHWMEDSIHDIPVQRPQQLAQVINNFVDELSS
ncbi:MAG TPA: alpha/beta hydrolase [Dehalococcoidia bacterium]|nr:alpha/beta hydrolase [Dehalococcoidia bacterium]